MSDIVPYQPQKESIIVAVNKQNYKSIISQVVAQHKLIEHRDVGDIVAAPVEDYVKGKAHTIKVTIQFYNFKEPPFTPRKGQKWVRPYCNIPDFDRTKLDWLTIKNACGGVNGYNWGRWRAWCTMDNGRKMEIYGGSAKTAEERLMALAALSTAKILTVTVAEEKPEGKRAPNKRMFKPTTRVYPAYFSVLNYQKIQVENELEYSGINSTRAGTFMRAKTPKIPLWIPSEPSNAKLQIIEALRVRVPTPNI